jgi:apolipoprotein N-acyltransferase
MGAVSAFVEWINFSVVPIWGTAQCFARIWTEVPMAMQFVSLTGVTGLVFVLVAAQALVANLLVDGAARLRSAAALAVLLLVPAGYNIFAWSERPTGSIRVAAVGWGRGVRAGRSSPYVRMDKIIEPNLRRAAAAGARLVVTPEVGLWLGPVSWAPILNRLGDIAKRYRMTLVVGYFDRKRNTNRAAYITPDGKVRDEYVKTHLIPTLEKYRAGTGRLTRVNVNDVPVGAMICQDDNFTDLARGYGRKRVRIVAVPTNDWAQVKKYHFDNSRFRPIENRYGVVRAASHGISAIVSAKGEVMARMDHLERGTGVIVADLPLYDPGSLYAVGGDWFVVLCALGLALGVRWTIAARRDKSVRT